MVLKRFTFLIILRIILLMGNVVLIAFIFGDKRLFFNQIILALILVLQVWELIRFVNHTNRELTRLFYAIKHSDFSITFRKELLGQSFEDLQESMIDIIQSYKQVKIEKEAQFHFLQMMVNQLHIGIIAMDQDHNITLINPTAEAMVGIRGLKNWRLLDFQNPGLVKELEGIGDNGKKLIEIKNPPDVKFVSADVRTLLILDKPLKLIALQDINSEIEQKEIEAWHKLIRILTHEIMNSVTPISSLTETIQGMLQDKNDKQKSIRDLDAEAIADIRFSLNTIHKRTEGLMQFVENYRNLTKVPRPVPEKVHIKPFLETISNLMANELKQKKITFHLHADSEMQLYIDPMLVEQVIINLITNSIHAVANKVNAEIELKTTYIYSQPVISIRDNGKGIPPKELSEIFVPFFTTKKDGSGIGLSLSKQIMSLHNGSIKVQSQENAGTTFFLHFPIPIHKF
jgi:two-component system, NtrC family, nitrogen regulation sensor histidine kinase NtrY